MTGTKKRKRETDETLVPDTQKEKAIKGKLARDLVRATYWDVIQNLRDGDWDQNTIKIPLSVYYEARQGSSAAPNMHLGVVAQHVMNIIAEDKPQSPISTTQSPQAVEAQVLDSASSSPVSPAVTPFEHENDEDSYSECVTKPEAVSTQVESSIPADTQPERGSSSQQSIDPTPDLAHSENALQNVEVTAPLNEALGIDQGACSLLEEPAVVSAASKQDRDKWDYIKAQTELLLSQIATTDRDTETANSSGAADVTASSKEIDAREEATMVPLHTGSMLKWLPRPVQHFSRGSLAEHPSSNLTSLPPKLLKNTLAMYMRVMEDAFFEFSWEHAQAALIAKKIFTSERFELHLASEILQDIQVPKSALLKHSDLPLPEKLLASLSDLRHSSTHRWDLSLNTTIRVAMYCHMALRTIKDQERAVPVAESLQMLIEIKTWALDEISRNKENTSRLIEVTNAEISDLLEDVKKLIAKTKRGPGGNIMSQINNTNKCIKGLQMRLTELSKKQTDEPKRCFDLDAAGVLQPLKNLVREASMKFYD